MEEHALVKEFMIFEGEDLEEISDGLKVAFVKLMEKKFGGNDA
jgi:hypothetical protein